MNTFIRILGILCAVAVITCWLALGAHVGLTHTVGPVKEGDLVAEIASAKHESRFVPGLDFLAAGILGAAAIIALSLPAPKTGK
jgi:hypothetical protein